MEITITYFIKIFHKDKHIGYLACENYSYLACEDYKWYITNILDEAETFDSFTKAHEVVKSVANSPYKSFNSYIYEIIQVEEKWTSRLIWKGKED